MKDTIHHPEIAPLIRALAPLAAQQPTKPAHWIALPAGDTYYTDAGAEWCPECGLYMLRHLRRRDRKHRDEYILDGGWISEHETPPHCAGCGVKLECSLLTYGALEELDHFRENPPTPGSISHAYEISEMLDAFEVTDAENAEAAREAIAIAQRLVEQMEAA